MTLNEAENKKMCTCCVESRLIRAAWKSAPTAQVRPGGQGLLQSVSNRAGTSYSVCTDRSNPHLRAAASCCREHRRQHRLQLNFTSCFSSRFRTQEQTGVFLYQVMK